MDARILRRLKKNKGKTFLSPRKVVFGRNLQNFAILDVDERYKKVKIKFLNGRYPALPLHFWMFDRTLEFLDVDKNRYLPFGAKLQPPYLIDSVEGRIWKKPYPTGKSPYKASPHVCDITALAGLAEYGYAVNPKTRRRVQGVRFVKEQLPSTSPSPQAQPTSLPDNMRERFLEKYNNTILNWTIDNEERLINGRRNYSWNDKALIECLNERNRISKAIIMSRIRNDGAVDLDTLDKVMDWGGFSSFPLRDPDATKRITAEAFYRLDNGNVSEAVHKLMSIHGVGISRASKIIGLSDQDSFCIYDSRVGSALRSLKHDDKRIFLCPPRRSRGGDVCSDKRWAENYERLIWTLEVMRDHLNQKGYPFRIADVEMALFMIGK